MTTQPWQDVLLGHADQLDPSVISPTMDEGLILGLRKWLDAESAWDATLPDGVFASERVRPSRPGMHDYVAYHAAEFIEEKVAEYGTRLRRTVEQAERAEVAAAVRGIGPAYDREQEQGREIEASNERQSRAYREWDRRVAGGVR